MHSEFESPWRRLPWTLGAAVFTWLALMGLFGLFLSKPQSIKVQPKPIDAKLIEMPAQPPAPKTPQPREQPVPRPRAPTPPKPAAKPAPVKPSPAKPAPAKPALPEKPVQSQQASPQGDAMGARAIYSPKPVIPEEFRQDALDVLVVARFHVAADGSASVELVIATPLPALNRTVLDTLNTWKFFPALQGGKPVPSVQDIRFRLVVK